MSTVAEVRCRRLKHDLRSCVRIGGVKRQELKPAHVLVMLLTDIHRHKRYLQTTCAMHFA